MSHAFAFWDKAEEEADGDPGKRMLGASDLTARAAAEGGGMVMPEVF